jgi:hypothetical protein
MKNHVLKRICVLSVCLATGFLSASCAIAPSADGPIIAAAGSSWTYERRDSGSYGKGTAQQTNRALGERMWQGRKVRATELPQGIRLTDAEKGDWLAMVKGDATLATWEPSLGYDWPLTVGKTFSRNYRFVNHVTKQSTEIKSTMTVESYEDVTVPAGTFKAFKVRYTDSMGVESVNWYSPDAGGWVKIQSKRSSNFPAGPGTQEFDLVSHSYKR